MELIEKMNKEAYEKMAKMDFGDEIRVVFNKTNLNNARRFAQEFNRLNFVNGIDGNYSVSQIAKKLGYIMIFRIK